MLVRGKQGSAVASVDLSSAGGAFYTHLQYEKKRLTETLQNLRERAYFSSESVFDVTVEDAIEELGGTNLSQYDIDEVEGTNGGLWSNIYTSQLFYYDDHTYGRTEAVRKYTDTNSADHTTIKFPTDDVVVTGDEIEIFIDETTSFTATVDTENGEVYPEHDVSTDMDAFAPLVDEFEILSIRSHTERIAKVLGAIADDDVLNRELAETEVTLSHHIGTKEWMPDHDRTNILYEMVDSLSQHRELTDDAVVAVIRALEDGAFIKDYTAKLFDLLFGKADAITMKWTYGSHPEVLQEIFRLADYEVTVLPQRMEALITRNPPDLVASEDFPERQDLTDNERDVISGELPRYVSYDRRTTVETEEVLYYLYRDDVINRDDLLAWRVQPWDHVVPDEDNVLKAIEAGHRLLDQMEDIDETHGTELRDKMLNYNHEKVFGQSG